MSSNYLRVLQLSGREGPEQIQRAYKLSRARYLRLTSQGPLKFYRKDLLTDTECAYLELKKHAANQVNHLNHYHQIDYIKKPPSILARQVAERGIVAPQKNAVKSPVKSGTILSGAPLKLKSRSLNHLRNKSLGDESARARMSKSTELDECQRALIEDEFCREVIYRLEGDMIRFDSRQELLQIAENKGLHLFRANMLIAQIVESVRQNKLFEPTAVEVQLLKNKRVMSIGGRFKAGVALLIVSVVIAIDVWVIRLLGK